MAFLEISQNSHENTCDRVSLLIELQAPATLLKERLCHRCFSVNYAKFWEISKNTFSTEHLWATTSGCYKVNDNKTFWKTVKPRFSNKCKVANTQKSRPEVLCKKGVLGNFTKASNFIKKETLARVFSCEFCEIPKNFFFIEKFWWLLL